MMMTGAKPGHHALLTGHPIQPIKQDNVGLSMMMTSAKLGHHALPTGHPI